MTTSSSSSSARRTAALTAAVCVAIAACASDDAQPLSTTAEPASSASSSEATSSVESNGDESTAASSEPTADPGETTRSDETTTDETTETADAEVSDEGETGVGDDSSAVLECPVGVEPQLLAPAEEGTLALPAEGVGVEPGRYGNDQLGVSLAFDIGAPFDDGAVFRNVIGLFETSGAAPASMSFQRSDEFVVDFPTDEQFERGVEVVTVDFDTWLADSGVDVVDDQAIEVQGFPARDVEILVPEDSLTRFDDRPLTRGWALQPSAMPQRVVRIELPSGDPLLFVGPGSTSDTAAATSATRTFDNLVIGDVGVIPSVYYADTPWDSGNFPRPAPVGACTIPSLAMGGIEFETVRAALLMGLGNQLWLLDPEQAHVGVLNEPSIIIIQADAAQTAGTFGPPKVGDPIETADDAANQLEAAGYELTPTDDDVTLLGAPAQTYEFVGPASDPFPFLAGNHVAGNGSGMISLAANAAGIVHIAATDAGVVLVMLQAEQGTNDADLLRDNFDSITETLRFQSSA